VKVSAKARNQITEWGIDDKIRSLSGNRFSHTKEIEKETLDGKIQPNGKKPVPYCFAIERNVKIESSKSFRKLVSS
jgi:hypothetical protein